MDTSDIVVGIGPHASMCERPGQPAEAPLVAPCLKFASTTHELGQTGHEDDGDNGPAPDPAQDVASPSPATKV